MVYIPPIFGSLPTDNNTPISGISITTEVDNSDNTAYVSGITSGNSHVLDIQSLYEREFTGIYIDFSSFLEQLPRQ